MGPEVRLAPDAEAQEVVERPAQHLRVAVQLGHRDRTPPLLDGDLGRAGEAELLGHDGLGQAEELPGLGDALADGLVGFHGASSLTYIWPNVMPVPGNFVKDGTCSESDGCRRWRGSCIASAWQ